MLKENERYLRHSTSGSFSPLAEGKITEERLLICYWTYPIADSTLLSSTKKFFTKRKKMNLGSAIIYFY
jgi:hypothetical protein